MDIIRERSSLFLASRMKRLAERMQADVIQAPQQAGLDIQPSQYPLLATLDRMGPLTVSELTEAVGVSQPTVTRAVARLIETGLVEMNRLHRDRRRKTIALTSAGAQAIALSKSVVWPRIEAAVAELTQGLHGSLDQQLSALEDMLAAEPLSRRILSPPWSQLSIREFSDDLAGAFHDINAEWIGRMYTLEPTDIEALQNPRQKIIDPGGAILFCEAEGLGLVGVCGLQKTGEGRFELTKMGVLEAARGKKAGEFLLRAMIARAHEMGAEILYLLSNQKSAAAIHLYEKAGFVHDAEIMRLYGARYARCDVAMLYKP